MNDAFRRMATVLVSLCAAWACASTAQSGGDSETHWLKSCNRDAECGSFGACECGLCTIVCDPTKPTGCKLGPPGSQCALGSSAKACADAAAPPQALCLGTGGATGTGGTTGSGGTGTRDSSASDANGAPAVDGGRTLTFSATVIDNLKTLQTPLGGVEVCIVDLAGKQNPTIPCVTTNSLGAFALGGLPRNTELIARFTKSGYDPLIVALDAKQSDLAPLAEFIGMDDVFATGRGWALPRGPSTAWGIPVPPDPNGGELTFFSTEPGATDGSIAGTGFHLSRDVTVTISPVAGSGPFYFADGTGAIALDAGTELGAGGMFVNLPPGEYTLTFHHPTRQCQVSEYIYGYSAGPNRLRAPVMAGTGTNAVGVTCL